jgi:hypothetical protein
MGEYALAYLFDRLVNALAQRECEKKRERAKERGGREGKSGRERERQTPPHTPAALTCSGVEAPAFKIFTSKLPCRPAACFMRLGGWVFCTVVHVEYKFQNVEAQFSTCSF